ncbi:30S ribosomal protein S4 [candidate division TA06 bacterium B3_TA06]|uniref:Small ribosomal subunit protein uS4 n=1 Tax=candidate division TA06 bacterium B3_TA06 TaxID=2012487 RepID=A0A532V422_UNCT6|nr:MAG: 30S ribosomal protein S4 [Candidatus Stahlbacteria bacterium]TKJ41964.1 MAG: 30S ribosomal protein S4 [candidate division TA06 bacterium B3_TA06]
MARDLSPSCKRCRREGEKLFLKGERCLSEKCALSRRGAKERSRYSRRASAYALQLKEKQKLRLMYGMFEGQFRRFFKMAAKRGNPAIGLLLLLERRLDNVVYRIGWAQSRPQARQMVRHGHIAVSGHKVDITSYLVKAADQIELRKPEGASAQERAELVDTTKLVPWLSADSGGKKAQIERLPAAEDVADIPINTQLVVGLYSK